MTNYATDKLPQATSTPDPISDSLSAHIKDAVSAIPTGQRGSVTGAVSTQGVEASVGVRMKKNINVGGWAGKQWGGGWSAGAKGSVSF